METGLRSRITGVGSYAPPRVVTNDELSLLMDTSDTWITERTGIKSRRWVDVETTTSDLALRAAEEALDAADVAKEDLDMILLATLSPDHDFPGTACFLQAKMELPGIPAMDVRQQCSGFVYAMAVADQFIRAGTYRRILVVGAEIHSKGLDLTTRGRDVSVLFGDGAGAVVVEATRLSGSAPEAHIISTHLHADGAYAEELWLAAPGMAYPNYVDPQALEEGHQYPRMNGRAVFVHATQRMGEALQEALDANGVRLDDVDLFLFHQANLRISQSVAKHMAIPPAKVFDTIEQYGNTTAASIPIGISEAVQAGRLEPGMLVAVAAFGSGFTWGSMLFRW